MSSINGDKARANRRARAGQQRRERWRALQKPAAPKAQAPKAAK